MVVVHSLVRELMTVARLALVLTDDDTSRLTHQLEQEVAVREVMSPTNRLAPLDR